MKSLKQLSISKDTKISFALKKMDDIKRKLLIVLDDNDKFYSLLSIGDIQRAIIKNISLDSSVRSILREKVKVASIKDSSRSIADHMKERRNEFMPVIDENNQIIKIVFWEDLFASEKRRDQSDLNLPVVIMAGGLGSRLKPITNILPKPLVPIGEKTVIEEIMDRFVDFGCSDFFISINYKAELIKHYFESIRNSKYRTFFFQEDKPLGTAGSLYLLKERINSSFFVTNCDIIIDQDLDEIYDYHTKNKNQITIVSVIKYYDIPYGKIETGKNGKLLNLVEKPKFTFQINSGMYILEPDVLNSLPQNRFFHITDLIEKIKNSGKRIGVFPLSDGYYTDIGEWENYLKVLRS